MTACKISLVHSRVVENNVWFPNSLVGNSRVVHASIVSRVPLKSDVFPKLQFINRRCCIHGTIHIKVFDHTDSHRNKYLTQAKTYKSVPYAQIKNLFLLVLEEDKTGSRNNRDTARKQQLELHGPQHVRCACAGLF